MAFCRITGSSLSFLKYAVIFRVAEVQDGESPRGGHHGVVRLIPELSEHSQIPLKPFLIRVVAEEHHAGETHVEFPV